MGAYVASRLVKAMTQKRIQVDGSRILIMGLSFKENCPDLRNTRVVDIGQELKDYNCQVDFFDPWVSPEEAKEEYGIDLLEAPEPGAYDAIVLAVAHREFREMGAPAIRNLGKDTVVLYDLKYILQPEESDLRL